MPWVLKGCWLSVFKNSVHIDEISKSESIRSCRLPYVDDGGGFTNYPGRPNLSTALVSTDLFDSAHQPMSDWLRDSKISLLGFD